MEDEELELALARYGYVEGIDVEIAEAQDVDWAAVL